MLDEDSLRQLAEMGIDVYVPRRVAGSTVAASPPRDGAQPTQAPGGEPAIQAQTAVVLLADTTTAGARMLIADVVRALGFARISCAQCDAGDERALATAAALVMFGSGQVRAAGALVPSQRQREIGWVAAAELDTLAREGSAKRALWSELKRVARELAAHHAVAPR